MGVSSLMPSQNSNVRIVLSYGYISTGLVLYLVARGLLIQAPISRYDFMLVLTLLVVSAVLLRHLTRNSRESFYHNVNKKVIAGGAALFACLIFGIVFLDKGLGYFLAWAASGDSRNHVQASYFLSNQGSIPPETLSYPYLSSTISVF
jgi:hypothetical protein